MRSVIACVAVGGGIAWAASAPVPLSDADKLRAALVGTWEHVSADVPKGERRVKHITPTHYCWVHCAGTGEVVATSRGTWKLVGGQFTQTCEFASVGYEHLQGKVTGFAAEVKEGKWNDKGTLSTGFVVDEVWQRVPAAK